MFRLIFFLRFVLFERDNFWNFLIFLKKNNDLVLLGVFNVKEILFKSSNAFCDCFSVFSFLLKKVHLTPGPVDPLNVQIPICPPRTQTQ